MSGSSNDLLLAADPASPTPSSELPDGAAPEALEGELAATPQSALVDALLTFALVPLARRLLRAVFGYRARARARITEDGLELTVRRELWGRTLREESVVVPYAALARLTRETRYSRVGLYAGLVSLALGTYLGAGLFVDGVKTPGGSPALLGFALLVVVVGLGLDLAATTLWRDGQGACRLVILPKRGPGYALTGVAPEKADEVLRRAFHGARDSRVAPTGTQTRGD